VSRTVVNTTSSLVARARDKRDSLARRHEAFTQLVERTQQLAVGLAVSLVGDAEDARDVAQESLITAWRLLDQLRDPDCFEPWLMSIVARQCKRLIRRRSVEARINRANQPDMQETGSREYHDLVASAISNLPPREREATVLFYLLGYTQKQISRLLGAKEGTVSKRLHAARASLRKSLPREVRTEFMRSTPSREFSTSVSNGVFDDYTGVYRFDERPELTIRIRREAGELIGESNGQRTVIASSSRGRLVASAFDGEGKFGRNSQGVVTHFIYYEFGRRMGTARKV